MQFVETSQRPDRVHAGARLSPIARNIRSPYIEGEGAQAGSEQLHEMQVRANTSPAFPPVPQQPGAGMDGIETPATNDNLDGVQP